MPNSLFSSEQSPVLSLFEKYEDKPSKNTSNFFTFCIISRSTNVKTTIGIPPCPGKYIELTFSIAAI